MMELHDKCTLRGSWILAQQFSQKMVSGCICFAPHLFTCSHTQTDTLMAVTAPCRLMASPSGTKMSWPRTLWHVETQKNLCFVEDLLSCLFGAFLVIIERDRGGRWKYSWESTGVICSQPAFSIFLQGWMNLITPQMALVKVKATETG